MGLRRWVAALAVPVVAVLSTVLATPAQADGGLPIRPPAPAPVDGIPAPCVSQAAWPAEATPGQTAARLQKQFHVTLVGEWWTQPENRPLVKIVWETLDAISCTDYVNQIAAKNKRPVVLNAAPISGWAWGDWGLTRPGALTLDFAKWQQALKDQDPGRLVRLLVHEMAHAWAVDSGENPAYWTSFQALFAKQGTFSTYGSRSVSETFADVVGYYVGRCAKDNPYDKGSGAYYEFVRTHVFRGVEFGGAPGRTASCTPGIGAMKAPGAGTTSPGWQAPGATRK